MPIVPSYPRRTLIVALGAFVGLGFGVVLALVRDTLSTGFRKVEDIETTFGLSSLASVPLVESPRRWRALHVAPLLGDLRGLHRTAELSAPADSNGHDRNAAATRRLAGLALDQPDSPFAESIRSLLFSLKHAAPERAMTIVLVTSALPGEGKSTVAVNLARMAAAGHDRTLLIDGDLRRPNLATAFDIPNSTGLADLLAHNRDLSGTLHRDTRTGLYVMAGTTRLSGAAALSLLSSQEMGKVLAVVRRHFDLVVLDAPPLVTVTDSRALIELVDGVVMVVASEDTSRDAIATALRESPGIEEKLIGVVLNKAAGAFDHRYHEVASAEAAA
jgi:succinoglycan biosynthesis transport protein ExoP